MLDGELVAKYPNFLLLHGITLRCVLCHLPEFPDGIKCQVPATQPLSASFLSLPRFCCPTGNPLPQINSSLSNLCLSVYLWKDPPNLLTIRRKGEGLTYLLTYLLTTELLFCFVFSQKRNSLWCSTLVYWQFNELSAVLLVCSHCLHHR